MLLATSTEYTEPKSNETDVHESPNLITGVFTLSKTSTLECSSRGLGGEVNMTSDRMPERGCRLHCLLALT